MFSLYSKIWTLWDFHGFTTLAKLFRLISSRDDDMSSFSEWPLVDVLWEKWSIPSDTAESYFLCKSLNKLTSVVSPRHDDVYNAVYSQLESIASRSKYARFLICLTCLVALFHTFSISSISFILQGNQVMTPYSRCGLTGDLYSTLKHLKSIHEKVLLITAMIPFAFLVTICIYSENFKSLSIMILRLFSNRLFSMLTILPSLPLMM